MRIAVAGKGGTGKTTIAGILTRILARAGRPVVAVDADTNPNLAAMVGLEPEAAGRLEGLPTGLLDRVEVNGEWRTILTRPAEDVVADHAVTGPDGVRVMLMGQVAHAGKGCMCRAHSSMRTFLEAIVQEPARDGEAVIMDMEAGLEHLSRGTGRHVDVMVAAVEPYYRALETGRRVVELARELGVGRIVAVANKVRDEADRDAVRAYLEGQGIESAGSIPFDPTLMEAERAGRAPFDHDPGSPAVVAVEALAGTLEERPPTPLERDSRV